MHLGTAVQSATRTKDRTHTVLYPILMMNFTVNISDPSVDDYETATPREQSHAFDVTHEVQVVPRARRAGRAGRRPSAEATG
jgi:hypothetical protein